MSKHGEVQWTLIWRAEIVSWIDALEAIVKQVAAAQNICWGFPPGMVMAVSSVSHLSRIQDSPLLHFPAESLWPQSTETVINCVKTALHYLLYPKVVFIDWNSQSAFDPM